MDNGLNILGIARKAGKLEYGEEPVGAAARAKHARVIVVAADAAENTKRRASHFAEACSAPVMVAEFTKDDMGRVTGRGSCALAAICDPGLAYLFAKDLAQKYPDSYGEVAEELRLKAERAEQRRKEKRLHEKNKRLGKKRGG